MTAIVFAASAGLITTIAMTLVLRYGNPDKRLAHLVLLFFAGLFVLMISVLAIAPKDALADRLQVFVFSSFLYTAGFWGGLMQLYNLADRGLSLRILLDIHENQETKLSLPLIAVGYSSGRGLGWMYEKRLAGMMRMGLIERHDGDAVITAKGKRFARWFSIARSILGMAPVTIPGEGR